MAERNAMKNVIVKLFNCRSATLQRRQDLSFRDMRHSVMTDAMERAALAKLK